MNGEAHAVTPTDAFGPRSVTTWREVTSHLPTLARVGLALGVVHLYAIEGPIFERLFGLAAAGFAVNIVLPMRHRLPFFVALSLGGAFLALGPSDAPWLIAIGLLLIGVVHLPASVGVRVVTALLAGAALATARAGWFGVPWSSSVWPVLGSMFMFRLAIYMYSTLSGGAKPAAQGGTWARLAYFFMLPNMAFPLFPVVDYQTFVRTYYDRDAKGIYEQGLTWIARGLVHLLLYRLVYQGLLLDPVDVDSLGDLVQLVLGTFLLYLRVSGQFHIIVGLLHLFGFRLPETHKLYYLASSFTDLWRRINIYWTEFMMKLVFYPTYFRVKRVGPVGALVIATAVVFTATWLLHAYQWFWLRGGFPITPHDTLFWAMLGALVTTGAVRELRATKKPVVRKEAWSAARALRAAATFVTFALLWWLWSSESIAQMVWTLGAAANVDLKGVALAAATVGVVAALGGRDWTRRPAETPAPIAWLRHEPTRTTAMLALLLVAGLPAVGAVAPPIVASTLRQMKATGLNARDTTVQHRGYYEQLDVRPTANTAMAGAAADRGSWQDITDIGVLRPRKDVLIVDLQPSRSVVWNGRLFSTNRWGMRDRDYAIEKPPDTLRIALLGPSHVMGDNVPDSATFESLAEQRLNREYRVGAFERFEILNFGMPSYSSLQQLAILEDRVFAFRPDMVILTTHVSDHELTERALQRIVWNGVEMPYAPVAGLLHEAGLDDVGAGPIAVPFATARLLAGRVGIETRMPFTESASRVRRISDRTTRWVLQRFAEVTTAHGARPAMLALNVVVDRVPEEIPHAETVRTLGLPVLDLFDLYPPDRLAALRAAPWDDHPNAEAHRMAADRFYPMLTRMLDTTFGAAGPHRRDGDK